MNALKTVLICTSAEAEVLHDERRGDGDADAIEVGDDGEEEREPQDAEADT